MSAQLTIVSEDFSNLHDSWTFQGLYRAGAGSAVLRVEIRANAYKQQSWAKIESWRASGWEFFTSIPVEEWYGLLPSYTRRELSWEDTGQFRFFAGELLERYCEALWGTTDGIELRSSDRRSEYRDAQDDGAIPIGGELATR
jgi:hypothetical protein